MRRAIAAFAAAVLTLLAAPGLAAARSTGCTEHAGITWDSEPQTLFVGGAEVAVPGCADGELVGLQLLTDHGDVPRDPLVVPVAEERAVFDLTPLAVRIEPVTGVRVLLHGKDRPVTGGQPVDPAPRQPGPEVLGESVTRGGSTDGDGGTVVLGTAERRAAGPLPRTGDDLLVPLALGLALVVVGSSALHTRRRGRGPGPRR